MIGIVVVSHSRPLAEAAVALATSMVPTDGPVIRIAAGINAPPAPGHETYAQETYGHETYGHDAYGTDATAVAAALTEAASLDGVLVLMDIGSSVLSAQLAVELLGPEAATRVALCSAPLVEGLVAAVVTAAGGADLPRVAAEARAGLRAKQELLDDTAPRTDTAPLTGDGPASEPRHVPATATLSRDVAVTSPLGLHLRSVARLVALVGSYAADVRLADPARGNGPVDATSITDVLALAAGPGDTLRVEATGRQAREVLEAIAASAVTGFGDLEEPGPDRMPATDAADEGTRADRST